MAYGVLLGLGVIIGVLLAILDPMPDEEKTDVEDNS